MANDLHIGHIPELRQFGKNLNAASGNLTNLFNLLGQQMDRACSTWQDKQAQEFMGQFTQQRREIDKMSQMMMEFSRYIEGYCQKAEALQSHR